MIELKLRYKISEMRKKSGKEFYKFLKDNNICTCCKSNMSDDKHVKCSICRYNEKIYKQEIKKNKKRKGIV